MTIDNEIDNIELKYKTLKEDFETAINYNKLVDGFEDLKQRLDEARTKYYNWDCLEATF